MQQEYLEQYKKLAESFLANGGIQAMADTAFSIFKNPIVVMDPYGRILGSAGYTEAQKTFFDKNEWDALQRSGVFEAVSQDTGICFFALDMEDAAAQEACATGIRIHNTVVAYVLMLPGFGNCEISGIRAGENVFQENSITEDSDWKALFLTFRDFLCQELMKNRSYQGNREEYMSYLLMDLLTNKYPDEQTIQRRFETVDFTPADHMNMVVVRKRIEGARGCSMELVAVQVRPILAGAICAVIEDSLVLLLNFPQGRKIEETMLNQLRQICANNDLIAGISSSFTSLSDLVKHYRLATRTALVCQRYIEDHRVIFYDDVFDLALLEYCDRHNHLMDFVHSSILHLMDYDTKYGTDYLYTFWVYTECGCNTQEAAAKLYIHKNTLVYRVNKIKELLGSDLTSGKDLFAFQLSMRILRMLGKLAK